MNKKDFLITVIVVVLAIALVATIVILKKTDDTPDTPNTGVAHDHNGDGIPDHGDDAHGGNATEGTTGGNVDAVIPDDSDVDISIDLEDVPSDTTGSGSSNDTTKPTTGNDEPTTGATEPTTGATEPTTGATEPTTGNDEPTTGATEPTTGTTEPTNPSSGAVSGNEIDFDDLLNAGRN